MNRLLKDLEDLYLRPPINKRLFYQYLRMGQVSFFNWEFFEQRAVIKESLVQFEFDFSLKETKTFQRLEKEKQWCKFLLSTGLRLKYWKIIPDEEIPFLWPEMIVKETPRVFERRMKELQRNIQRFTSKELGPTVRVVRMSEILKDPQLSQTYWKSYLSVRNSYFRPTKSSLVGDTKIREDLVFRRTHYSEKPIIPEPIIRDYSGKMFAVFAAETSTLLALEKTGVLPNMVLVSNESNRAIKKYETLRKIENRDILPKIFVL